MFGFFKKWWKERKRVKRSPSSPAGERRISSGFSQVPRPVDSPRPDPLVPNLCPNLAAKDSRKLLDFHQKWYIRERFTATLRDAKPVNEQTGWHYVADILDKLVDSRILTEKAKREEWDQARRYCDVECRHIQGGEVVRRPNGKWPLELTEAQLKALVAVYRCALEREKATEEAIGIRLNRKGGAIRESLKKTPFICPQKDFYVVTLSLTQEFWCWKRGNSIRAGGRMTTLAQVLMEHYAGSEEISPEDLRQRLQEVALAGLDIHLGYD